MWRLGNECERIPGHSAGTEDKACQTDDSILRKVYEYKEYQKRLAKEQQASTSHQKKENRVYEGHNITGIKLSSNRKEKEQWSSEPTVISGLGGKQIITMLSSDSSESVSEIRTQDNSNESVTLAIKQRKHLETEIQEERPLKQPYKAEVCLSPHRVQLANDMQRFSPRSTGHAQKTSDLGAGERKDNKMKTTATGMQSLTQLYKTESNFYPRIVGKQKVTAVFINDSEAGFSTTIPNKQLLLTSECKEQSTKSIVLAKDIVTEPREVLLQRTISTNTEVQAKETFQELGEEMRSIHANVVEFEPSQFDFQRPKLLRQSDIKVMPDTPKYEVTLSPTSKKILAASYSGWEISTHHGFDWLLEQGYDAEPFVFQKHQSKKCIEQKEQEKEIRRAHLQNKIAEAICRDANNNIIIEKTLEKPSTEVKQRDESPKLEETTHMTATSLSEDKQEQAPLVPQNVVKTSLQVVGGIGVNSRSEIPKTQSKQVLQAKPDTATRNIYKTETKFCPSKSVETKVEAKQVIQKKLDKAMKSVFKSETKVHQKKVLKEEKLPKNLQKLEQRDSAKYELMWEDIKKANTEIYQSPPVTSFSPEEDTKTKDDLSLKETHVVLNGPLTPEKTQNDSNTEEPKAEIKLPEGIKEEDALSSSGNYKSETKLVLKKSELKRLSKPDPSPRLSWKDEDFIRGVFKSEAYLTPNLGKKASEQRKENIKTSSRDQHQFSQKLDSPGLSQVDFPSSSKQDKRKGPTKIYKVSVATVQKSRPADKKGTPHPPKKGDLFSYRLNTCYKLSKNQLQSHEKNKNGELGIQGNTANVAVKVNPEWTTTISFEQNKE